MQTSRICKPTLHCAKHEGSAFVGRNVGREMPHVGPLPTGTSSICAEGPPGSAPRRSEVGAIVIHWASSDGSPERG